MCLSYKACFWDVLHAYTSLVGALALDMALLLYESSFLNAVEPEGSLHWGGFCFITSRQSEGTGLWNSGGLGLEAGGLAGPRTPQRGWSVDGRCHPSSRLCPARSCPLSPAGLARSRGSSSRTEEQGAVRNKGDFASDSSEIAICQQPPERLKVNESVLESEGYHPC